MLTTYTNPTRYDVRRDLVPPPNSYCIVTLLVLRTTWWWPTYKAETCSCVLHSVAYYIVVLSDKLLCFWLLVYVVWSWGLCVRFAGCCSNHTDNLKTKAPNTTGSNHLYNTLELLMMGIVVPETCWASNKICNKNHLLHLVGILFPHINDDARSKPNQIHIASLPEDIPHSHLTSLFVLVT